MIFKLSLNRGRFVLYKTFLCFLVAILGCDRDLNDEDREWDSLCVTASAYNSLHYQTEGDPNITAWGDTLEPGMKVIAVSRDLIKMGIDHNSKVKIEGFDGVYLVKDKMHYRWKQRIDIYMGENVKRARQFGRKKLNIAYIFKKDSILP